MDAVDYAKKKKYVFKLMSRPLVVNQSATATHGQTEILLQAENESEMVEWRNMLQTVCEANATILKKVSGEIF